MSGFKDRVARDVRKVFLNLDKFAEMRTVIYDGVTYDRPVTAPDGDARAEPGQPLPELLSNDDGSPEQSKEQAEDTEAGDSPEPKGIPIVLTGPVEKDREQLRDDHIQGLHKVTATLYCASEDLGGKLPKQGKSIQVNTRPGGKFFKEYYITAAANEMGIFRIELEEMDE